MRNLIVGGKINYEAVYSPYDCLRAVEQVESDTITRPLPEQYAALREHFLGALEYIRTQNLVRK